jgi:hypothetical protein
MGGKAILYVVLSFSLTFLLIGNNFNRMSLSAMDNMTYYACKQISHNIALSGANIACNKFYMNQNWIGGYYNVPNQGGTFSVKCEVIDAINTVKRITSVSTFSGYYSGYSAVVYHDTVIITFQPASFAQFVYYSVKEVGGIYWATGDTTTGRFHSQDYIFIQGSPYWYGYATSLMGIFWHGGTTNKPTFAGGFQAGVNIPISNVGVSNTQAAALSGGKYFTGQSTVYVTFAGDSIRYRYSSGGTDSTRKISTFAPNGVIFINGTDVHVQGTVKGAYTLATNGNIWIDDNIVYTSNPLTNPDCQDYLGLVALSSVTVTDNTANRDGVNINGSIYCQGIGGNSGTFSAQNYNKNGIRTGPIKVIGGIIQNNKGQINTTDNNGVIKTGWNREYRFDTRLTYHSPPVFPLTGNTQIISWYESGLNTSDRNLY